jgi:mannitol-1-phosphate 5-dehydrogenase
MNGNRYFLNIARFDRIFSREVGPVEIFNPNVPAERENLLGCLSAANDVVTAVPSTSLYERGGIARLLREGFAARRKNGAVMVYASENEIGAARMLEKQVFPRGTPSGIQFADTVIGRMGGVQSNQALIGRLGLLYLTPESREALLVEEFDDIIIEKCRIPPKYGFRTGFSMFHAAGNIHVHEEQKLFGHNAVHSLLGFLGRLKGYEFMSDYAGDVDFGYIGVDALRIETGRWFRKKHAGVEKAITTPNNYEAWAVQLLRRIVNPFLYDAVDRVIRDPARKLGWSDRLAGVMRHALSAGISPGRYALGTAAALSIYRPGKRLEYQKNMTKREALANLTAIWRRDGAYNKSLGDEILGKVGNAFDVIRDWRMSGQRCLYTFLKQSRRLKEAGIDGE